MATDPYLEIDDFETGGNPEVPLNDRGDDIIGKMVGYIAVALSDANYNLYTNQDADGDAIGLRNATFEFTGTLTFQRVITLPPYQGKYTVWNNTTGGYSLIFEASGAASPTISVTVPAGKWADLVVEATTLDVRQSNGALSLSDLTVTGSFTSPGIDDNADAIALTIDSSERLLAGHTASIAAGTIQHKTQVFGTGSIQGGISVSRWSADTTASRLSFSKSRGATPGTFTVVTTGDNLGRIDFDGADGTNLDKIAAQILGSAEGTVGASRVPGRLVFSTAVDAAGSALTEAMRIDSGQTVLVATDMTVGSSSVQPDGTLHVHTATAGSVGALTNTVATLENNTDAGLQFLIPDANDAFISVGSPTRTNDHIQVTFDLDGGTAPNIKLLNDTSERFRFTLDATPVLFINDTDNANMGTGLTINQGTSVTQIVAFKNSNVSHPMTGTVEADTFGDILTSETASGGLRIRGFKDADGSAGYALLTVAILGEAVDATKTTAGIGVTVIDNYVTNGGTGQTAPAADGNLVVIRSGGSTRFIFDADGDSHQDIGTAWTNFDAHDDVVVAEALAVALNQDDPVRQMFVRDIEDAREILGNMPGKPLVSFNDDGHHFVNMSRLAMLHHGAIRQQRLMAQVLAEALEEASPGALAKVNARLEEMQAPQFYLN